MVESTVPSGDVSPGGPSASPPYGSNIGEKVAAAREITALFSLERYAYVSCCGIAVLLLLANAVMLMREGIHATELTLLFGASGLITVSIARLIYMWNKLVELILTEVTK